MKIEVSIDLLKDFFAHSDSCKYCKHKGTYCIGESCNDSKVEYLIEKSKLVLDFDTAILEIKKIKNAKPAAGLLFAIETLEEIKKEFQQ